MCHKLRHILSLACFYFYPRTGQKMEAKARCHGCVSYRITVTGLALIPFIIVRNTRSLEF